MKYVNLIYDEEYEDVAILCVPDYVADDVEHITNLYAHWLYNNCDKHPFWIITEKGYRIVNATTESYIWWLNCHYIRTDEKAYIVSQHVRYNPEYPSADL